MKMEKLILGAILLGCTAVPCRASHVLTNGLLEPFDVPQLVQGADIILEGTVAEQQSTWADDHSTIYTFVTLSDIKRLGGKQEYAGSKFTVRVEGGMVEDPVRKKKKGLLIPGCPQFITGERVLLFIQGNAQQICPFVGWDQGALEIRKEAGTGKEKLFRRDHEIAGIHENRFMTKPAQAAAEDRDAADGMGIRRGGAGLADGGGGSVGEEGDPVAKELRLQDERAKAESGKMVRALGQAAAQEFTLQDFHRFIESRPGFRPQGLGPGGAGEPSRTAISADINLHKKGSPLRIVAPKGN